MPARRWGFGVSTDDSEADVERTPWLSSNRIGSQSNKMQTRPALPASGGGDDVEDEQARCSVACSGLRVEACLSNGPRKSKPFLPVCCSPAGDEGSEDEHHGTPCIRIELRSRTRVRIRLTNMLRKACDRTDITNFVFLHVSSARDCVAAAVVLSVSRGAGSDVLLVDGPLQHVDYRDCFG